MSLKKQVFRVVSKTRNGVTGNGVTRNRVTGFFSLFFILYVCLILFQFFAVVVVVVADLVCLFAFLFLSLFFQVKKNVNIIILV